MGSHNPFGNSEVEESILMEHLVGTARGYAEMMAYEFSREREQHVETSEKIERAISNSGDLLLSITNWPHKVGSEFRDDSAQQSRTALEDGLRSLAAALERHFGLAPAGSRFILVYIGDHELCRSVNFRLKSINCCN
jgi:hypothetical protein